MGKYNLDYEHADDSCNKQIPVCKSESVDESRENHRIPEIEYEYSWHVRGIVGNGILDCSRCCEINDDPEKCTKKKI